MLFIVYSIYYLKNIEFLNAILQNTTFRLRRNNNSENLVWFLWLLRRTNTVKVIWKFLALLVEEDLRYTCFVFFLESTVQASFIYFICESIYVSIGYRIKIRMLI